MNNLKEYLIKDLDKIISQDEVISTFLKNVKADSLSSAPKAERIKYGGSLMKQMAMNVEYIYICSILEGGLNIELDTTLTKPQKDKLASAKLGTSSIPFISNGEITFHDAVNQFLSQLDRKN